MCIKLKHVKLSPAKNKNKSPTKSKIKDKPLPVVDIHASARRLGAVTQFLKERTKELERANVELVFQNNEKEKRAAELIIANGELAYQNKEKGKRAAELIIANKELAFQNEEKQKRAAELIIANGKLAFQIKRAAELLIANGALAFQNEEKEKREAELITVNTQLESFSSVSSHDLQEPLRKIQTFAQRILETETQNLSDRGKEYFNRLQTAARRMQRLIEDLLGFSRLNIAERHFENTDLNKIIEEVKTELQEDIQEKQATIEASQLCKVNIIPFQFRQLMHNLIGNALKFSNHKHPPHIIIKSTIETGSNLNNGKHDLPAGWLLPEQQYCHLSISDNGIGLEPQYKHRIFEVFQKLHGKDQYPGTGIGLSIVKKVVENHNGIITVISKLDEGATFNIFFPISPPEDSDRKKQLHQLNILLADDDVDDCIFFKEALQENSPSAHLRCVHDGEQLMQLLTDRTNELPHVLFLDLNMPRKNGFECLSEIKLNQILKQLPIVIFSTSLEQEVVNLLYKSGALYFIRKPSEISQFKKIIHQTLTIITQANASQPTRERFVLTVQNSG